MFNHLKALVRASSLVANAKLPINTLVYPGFAGDGLTASVDMIGDENLNDGRAHA